jgi:hypothetical protein
VTGYRAINGSTEDLARGMSWIVEDRARYISLSANARERMVNLFDRKIIAQKHIRAYRDIVERVRGSGSLEFFESRNDEKILPKREKPASSSHSSFAGHEAAML